MFGPLSRLQELKWIGWMDTVEPQQIKPGSAVESIIVQTLDSVRYGHLACAFAGDFLNVFVEFYGVFLGFLMGFLCFSGDFWSSFLGFLRIS